MKFFSTIIFILIVLMTFSFALGTTYDININGTIYRVIVITTNGTLEVADDIPDAAVLVVAGGAAGGKDYYSSDRGAGGGGAGGLLIDWEYGTISADDYVITIGGGGQGDNGSLNGQAVGNSGGDTEAFGITAIGGGGGAGHTSGGATWSGSPGDGGSGGGHHWSGVDPGSGTVDQGYDGGLRTSSGGLTSGSGGGGAGSVGGSTTDGTTAGLGGDGIELDINGSVIDYALGGNGTGGSGTQGGVGDTPGSAGNGVRGCTSGNGADGIVIIRYQASFETSVLTITNNTIFSNGTAIYLNDSVVNSTVYHNNLTSAVWINNAGTNNTFNITGEGNIYYLGNGVASWDEYDITSTTAPDWADGGTDVPLDSSVTEWIGLGNDSHPWTDDGAVIGDSTVTIWNGSNWLSHDTTNRLDFRNCRIAGFPVWCDPNNQNNITGISKATACTSSTGVDGTCANTYTEDGGDSNWTLVEPDSVGEPFHGNISFINESFVNASVLDISIYSNYLSGGMHAVDIRFFNWTSGEFDFISIMAENEFGWVNRTVEADDYYNSTTHEVLVQFDHPANGNAGYKGPAINYIGIEQSNPIFRLQNTAVGSSSSQTIKTNATWGTEATLWCGNQTTTPTIASHVNVTTSPSTFSSETLAVGGYRSLYCFFYISNISSTFQRLFNIDIEAS